MFQTTLYLERRPLSATYYVPPPSNGCSMRIHGYRWMPGLMWPLVTASLVLGLLSEKAMHTSRYFGYPRGGAG
jgi:hypothetical protein